MCSVLRAGTAGRPIWVRGGVRSVLAFVGSGAGCAAGSRPTDDSTQATSATGAPTANTPNHAGRALAAGRARLAAATRAWPGSWAAAGGRVVATPSWPGSWGVPTGSAAAGGNDAHHY